LVTLITSAASAAGWENAQELANHVDEFAPAKHLLDNVSASATTFKLDDAHGPKAKDLLRIDDDPLDETYEMVEVVDAPAISALADDISADATQFDLAVAFRFKNGDQVSIEDEHLTITDAPSVTTLKADATATDTNIEVDSATGLKKDDVISLESEKVSVVSVTGNTLTVTRGASETEAKVHKAGATMIEASNRITVQRGTDGTTAKSHRAKTTVREAGDTIEVKRGAFGTTAAEHKAGTEVFIGPIPPGDTITGASGTPPCGQKSAAPAATPGAAVQVSGSVAVTLGDNFFKISDQQNPPLQATAGQPITFNITNDGTGVHDLHISAAGGTFTGNPCDTGGTDPCSDPSIIPGGQTATLSATLAAGKYSYRCDFHPTDMKGEITVQ
jgi:plastocyanin